MMEKEASVMMYSAAKYLLLIGMLSLPSGPIGTSSAPAQESQTTIQLRQSSFLEQFKPTRAAVVTTRNRLDRLHEQEIFSRAVADAMGTCLGIQATLADARLCQSEMPHHSGVFDEYLLVEMNQRLSAEAVVFCEVVEFTAYAPYAFRGHVVLVDTREAVSLLECEISLDLGCPEVRNHFQRYIDGAKPLTGLSTPKKFLDYCARVAVAAMAREF